MTFSLPVQTDDTWQLSKLRHESDDVIVELIWQQKILRVVIETNKSVSEKVCHNLHEIHAEIARLLGEKRMQSILENWHEVSYRKVDS